MHYGKYYIYLRSI